jgi:hypothetical protein
MDHGNSWCDITTHLKGQRKNMIKNRFYSILRKVKNNTRNNDYGNVNQLEQVEMYYMIHYIKNPAPIEEFKKKIGRNFMYNLTNDITLATLQQFSSDFDIQLVEGNIERDID